MALMGQRMHDHFAEALDPCRICLMGKEDTQRLLLSDPRIAARIAGILSDRLKDMEERLSDFAFKNVAQRIASTLLAIERNDRARGVLNGVCEVRMTHEQLAEFVGTYRETVTKVLNELRDQKLIELRRGKIMLIDIDGLDHVAQQV
jgi:CRP-like cAMP-binding protein